MKDWMMRYRVELLVASATGMLSLAVFFFTSLRFPNDDQFILYRYVDNIVAGHGFVYNLGERVLGSTTPLFTLFAALAKSVFPGIATPDIVAYLNILLLSGSAVFFYRVARHFVPFHYALLAVAVFMLNLSRTIPEGMETPLFLLTVFGFLHYLIEGKHYRASVLLALALLTRPDAGLIAAIAAGYWFYKCGFKECVRIGSVAGMILLPWIIFATFYFGSFVPQSLATKLHSNDIYNLPALQATKIQAAHISRIYWGKIVDPENIPVQMAINLAPVLLLSLYGAWRLIRTHAVAWVIVLIPLVYFASFAISNPIIFPWYLSEMEPFWILLSIVGIAHLLLKYKQSIASVLAAALLLVGPCFYYATLVSSTDAGSKVTAFTIGAYLKEHIAPGESLGIADIGIMGYITNAYVIDFIGLVTSDSVAFYPVQNSCAPDELYTIPPALIEHMRPTWFVAGDNQMDPCYRESDAFTELYERVHSVGTARVYHLKN